MGARAATAVVCVTILVCVASAIIRPLFVLGGSGGGGPIEQALRATINHARLEAAGNDPGGMAHARGMVHAARIMAARTGRTGGGVIDALKTLSRRLGTSNDKSAKGTYSLEDSGEDHDYRNGDERDDIDDEHENHDK